MKFQPTGASAKPAYVDMSAHKGPGQPAKIVLTFNGAYDGPGRMPTGETLATVTMSLVEAAALRDRLNKALQAAAELSAATEKAAKALLGKIIIDHLLFPATEAAVREAIAKIRERTKTSEEEEIAVAALHWTAENIPHSPWNAYHLISVAVETEMRNADFKKEIREAEHGARLVNRSKVDKTLIKEIAVLAEFGISFYHKWPAAPPLPVAVAPAVPPRMPAGWIEVRPGWAVPSHSITGISNAKNAAVQIRGNTSSYCCEEPYAVFLERLARVLDGDREAFWAPGSREHLFPETEKR